ncbi:MAG: ABC transporter permease [Verrucomicrobiales bacterium]|nr:ABC transporter permease [Verrucomicrobiales bacterium]
MRSGLPTWLRDYGMVLVLGALCLYYSFATFTDQQPVGEAAGSAVARRILGDGGTPSVLVIAGTTDEDRAFAGAAVSALTAGGANVVERVLGAPRDARVVLDRLAGEGRRLAYVATTAACVEWTLLKDLNTRFPSLGNPRILIPESRRWPVFLTRQNLLNVANQITVVAILAVGMTVVIITGGIDLSVGSLIALSAVVVSVLIRDAGGGVQAGAAAMVMASLAALGMCIVVGLFSGLMVTAFKVPPFIATLAVMQVASGLAFIIAKGGSIYELPDTFTWLGRGADLFGVPNAVILMLVLYVMTHLLMSRTVLGRWIYAVGDNAEAARLAGVHTAFVLLFAYAFCGAMAGLGGVLQASQLKSGAPTYGVMYELYAIAAVVVGGTSLAGGEGRVFGTLIGAFIIAVIQNGMNLTGVESYRQKVVLGVVILGAVLLDLLKKKDWRRLFRAAATPATHP